ncbi:unnamed protein product [Pylaiella littoralis]
MPFDGRGRWNSAFVEGLLSAPKGVSWAPSEVTAFRVMAGLEVTRCFGRKDVLDLLLHSKAKTRCPGVRGVEV